MNLRLKCVRKLPFKKILRLIKTLIRWSGLFQQAIKLLEFLSSTQAQNLYADENYEYPVNATVKPHGLLAAWGDFKADTVDVAAAGEFQVTAVKLMDRVGYK